jgi:NADP-dependent 3-hydroxy acid dehydrogenase YdfG
MLQPDDVAAAALFLATPPAHVWVPELVITPADAQYL